MAKKDDPERPGIHIQSHNQQGGITAHTVNIGPPSRTLSDRDLADTVMRLSKFEGTEVLIACLMADNEGASFALEIRQLLEKTGWRPRGAGISATLLAWGERGIVVRSNAPELPPALYELAVCITEFGYDVVIVAGAAAAGGNEVLVLGNAPRKGAQ